MRSNLPRLLGVGLLIALLGGGCGESEEIPTKTAAAVTADLQALDKRFRAGECQDARATVETLNGRVRELPRDTAPSVRETLNEGVGHLEKLVGSECKQKAEPVEEPVTPPAVTTPETPPAVTEPEPPPVAEPIEPQPEESKEAKEPKKPEKPKEPTTPEKPTETEKDICGESPSPRC